MKTKKVKVKQGFTIVELVIVIGVIGVLTAVLIPTFINLNKKAEEASNQSFVKNLNTQMAIREQEEGKNNSMFDAVEDAKQIGFDVEKLNPVDGRDLVWDSVSNRFLLLNQDGSVFYGQSEKKATKDIEIWKIYSAMPAESEQKYSIYAKQGWSTLDVANLKVGFDAGYNSINSVYYSGGASAQSASIRTNGNLCVLTVNAPADHVAHYGYAKETKVVAVNNMNSYHEYGTTHTLAVTDGKVVVEKTGVVFELTRADYTYVDDQGEHTIPAVTTNEITSNGGNVMESTVASVPQSTSFEINSLSQLESFRDATNSGESFAGKTVNLNVDITLNGPWTPISNYYRKGVASIVNGKVTNDKDVSKFFAGTFNGNKHTITGLTNEGILNSAVNTGYNSTTPSGQTEVTYGFFASVNNAVIKDITFKDVKIVNFDTLLGDCVSACVGFYNNTNTDSSKVLIQGINVSGSIAGYDNVGGVVGMMRNMSNTSNKANTYATISGCNAENITLKATRRSAGIISQISSDMNIFTLSNCTASGTASSNQAEDFEDGSIHYYLCGGLATWGQTTELKVVECTSTMSTSFNGSKGATNNFIIVEGIGTNQHVYDNTTNWNVNANGDYLKDGNTASVVPANA